MTDIKTKAYINLYAVLGSLETLCDLDEEAKRLASPPKPISLGFNITDGPKARLEFNSGKAKMVPNELGATIGLKLFSLEHLNDMVDGKKNPFPYKGFFSLKFLLKNFIELTNLLNKYLRASEEDLKDRTFFEKSTTLMFYLVVGAMAQIGNNDRLGMASASRIKDGCIAVEIAGGPCAYIEVKNNKLTAVKQKCDKPSAKMVFNGFDVARGLFDGELDAMTQLAAGNVIMSGFIPMIDNLNKILGRVSNYLA